MVGKVIFKSFKESHGLYEDDGIIENMILTELDEETEFLIKSNFHRLKRHHMKFI
jgi:hypothetical protein